MQSVRVVLCFCKSKNRKFFVSLEWNFVSEDRLLNSAVMIVCALHPILHY